MAETQDKQKLCGIIMPISAMPGYTAEHWQEVKGIIIQATGQLDQHPFKTEIVSNSDGEIDVIHKRIIQNIYNADIVVCDISGRNPNVLFELGMRLTFDKPTILIKDDQTDFIFDTGVIEHITYPKDLRYSKVVQFQSELAQRIKLTYEKSLVDPNFSTFLRNFGTFKVPQLDQTAVSDINQLMLEEINTIRKEFTSFKRELASNKSLNFNVSSTKDAIYKYVEETEDFDDADNIVKKDEFLSYLRSYKVDTHSLSLPRVKKFIEQAQHDALPF